MFKPHPLDKLPPRTKLAGYPAVYYPEHPASYGNGHVLYHRLVVENREGRFLTRQEMVHHKNGIITDFSEGNLIIMTVVEHNRHHHEGNRHKEKKLLHRICPVCSTPFSFKDYKSKEVCSWKCLQFSRRKVERPEKEELRKAIWEESTVKVAKRFGVTDKAVEKWCKTYGIQKPPVGYWAKQYASVAKQENVLGSNPGEA